MLCSSYETVLFPEKTRNDKTGWIIMQVGKPNKEGLKTVSSNATVIVTLKIQWQNGR